MKTHLNFLIFNITLLLTACGGNSSQSSDDIDRNLRNGLTNQSWVLESYGFQMSNKTDVIENDLSFEVQFFDPEGSEPGKYLGHEYCNIMSGSYETQDNSITITGPITTRKACPPPQATEELEEGAYQQELDIVTAAFRDAVEFEVNNDQLTLSTVESMQLIFALKSEQ